MGFNKPMTKALRMLPLSP